LTLIESPREPSDIRVFAAEDASAHIAFSLAALAGGVFVGAGGARLGIGVAAACAGAAALIASRMRGLR
jgi:hypothetical protein